MNDCAECANLSDLLDTRDHEIEALTERADMAERELAELTDRHAALKTAADNAARALSHHANLIDKHL